MFVANEPGGIFSLTSVLIPVGRVRFRLYRITIEFSRLCPFIGLVISPGRTVTMNENDRSVLVEKTIEDLPNKFRFWPISTTGYEDSDDSSFAEPKRKSGFALWNAVNENAFKRSSTTPSANFEKPF